jgi:hypothetical protein
VRSPHHRCMCVAEDAACGACHAHCGCPREAAHKLHDHCLASRIGWLYSSVQRLKYCAGCCNHLASADMVSTAAMALTLALDPSKRAASGVLHFRCSHTIGNCMQPSPVLPIGPSSNHQCAGWMDVSHVHRLASDFVRTLRGCRSCASYHPACPGSWRDSAGTPSCAQVQHGSIQAPAEAASQRAASTPASEPASQAAPKAASEAASQAASTPASEPASMTATQVPGSQAETSVPAAAAERDTPAAAPAATAQARSCKAVAENAINKRMYRPISCDTLLVSIKVCCGSMLTANVLVQMPGPSTSSIYRQPSLGFYPV